MWILFLIYHLLRLLRHTVVPTNFRIAATARSINASEPLKDPTLLTLPCSFNPAQSQQATTITPTPTK